MYSNIYVCNTFYHVYLSLLLVKGKGNVLILTDFTKGLYQYINKLKITGLFSEVIYIENEQVEADYKQPGKKLILNFLFYKKRLVVNYELKYEFLKNYTKSRNINLFVDESYLARYFLYKHDNIFLYDDGEGCYFQKKIDIKYILRYWLLGLPEGKGVDESIKGVYLRSPEKLPVKLRKRIEKKLHTFQLGLIESRTLGERRGLIKTLFGMEEIYENEMNVIIITQPFSEDGYVSEDYKIQLYKKIIDDYKSKHYKVYLKPHPREKSSYAEFSEIVEILNRDVPMELFNLDDKVIFSEGVAVQSTALTNANYINIKVKLGYSNFPELKKGKEMKDAIKI
jgi:hypothetical protein